MAKAGIAELKAELSRFLERVKAGEEIIVTDRGRPVARLVGIADPAKDTARLVHSGVVRPPTRRLDVEEVVGAELPPDPQHRLLDALLEERRSGR